MAHQLEIRDGRASFFSVLQTAWHGLGSVLTEAPTLEEAMEIIRGNYPVERVPLYIQDTRNPIQTPDGPVYGFIPSRLSCSIVRTDTGRELGRCTDKYEAVTNRQAFQALAPLLDAGIMRLETGGVIRDGAVAWMMAQFDLDRFGPTVREVFGATEDRLVPYGLLRADHTGVGSNYVGLTPVRVVCANTLAGAEAQMRAIRIPHLAGAQARTVEAAETLFQGIVERYEAVAHGFRVLRALHLAPEAFRADVLDLVAPDPTTDPKFNPEAKLAELVVERVRVRRATLERLWRSGKGHTGNGSAWEAWNGLVEALDHTDTFPTRPGAAWKANGLLDGQLAKMKHTVYRRLLTRAVEANIPGATEAMALVA